MNGFITAPYFQVNAYVGKFPFYLKAAAGASAEVFVGGHYGVFGKLGLEVNSLFEFTLMATLAGTQPEISYTDFETKIGEDGYVGLEFPYMAATIVYKF